MTPGRFGGALRFDAPGELVRVPASASLDLRRAMTLSAWVRPSAAKAGWRTILHRQTDAYFLMAGGARESGGGALDDLRVILLVGAAVWFCAVLASGRVRWIRGRRRTWWAPVALFLAGSVVDAVLMPSISLIGPILVAIWYAATASRRGEALSMYLIAAMLTGVTVLSLASGDGHELARDNGGQSRSAAVGLLLVTAAVLGARRSSSTGERMSDTAALRL
jgi:hypothetical protein